MSPTCRDAVITRAGAQRRGRAHGGAVSAARLGSQPWLSSGCLSSSEAAASSTRRALDAPMSSSGRTAASRRSAPMWVTASPTTARRASRSTRRGVSSRRGSSISTHTCANPAAKRRRPSRAARGRPRSAGSPRSSRCRTPSPRSIAPGRCARCSTSGSRRACATCTLPARSRSAGPVSASRRWPRWRRSACACSPTTVRGVQDASLMRRALEYAGGLGVTLAQHCEDETLAEGGHMHEGEWSSRLGIPGQPAEAEELMVMRDIALARLTGASVHFQHLSTMPVRWRWCAPRERTACAVTAEATPHHFTLTARGVRRLRPGVQGEPAAAHRDRRRGDQGGIGRRHHRRHRDRPRSARRRRPRSCRSIRRRPGMLGLETALALALTELGLSIDEVLALMSWQPAAIAGLARPPRRAGRRRLRPRTSASSIPPRRGRSSRRCSPAAAATPPSRDARSRVGCVTRCCSAKRS